MQEIAHSFEAVDIQLKVMSGMENQQANIIELNTEKLTSSKVEKQKADVFVVTESIILVVIDVVQ